jgi:HEAT repeats
MPSFVEQLAGMLRQLADPVTPHTVAELWCRIQAAGWDTCVPPLLSELQGDNPDVKRLVLAILSEEAEQIGLESTEPFYESVERLLADDDRLVRMAAIHTVRDLYITMPTAAAALRHIACNDKVELSRQALVTLIELDDGVVEELAQKLRHKLS